MALKQQALDRTTPPVSAPGRYKPPDQLLAFLEAPWLCRYRQPGHPRGQRRTPAYRHNDGIGVMLVMPISA